MLEIRPGEAIGLDQLRARLGDRVQFKDDPGWATACLAWNRIQEQRPQATIRVTSPSDVMLGLAYARAEGLKVAAQSSGHGAGAGLGALEGAIRLDLSGLRSVSVDPNSRIAKVGAGATWDDVMTAGAPHGLAGLPGSSPNVAVAGYCLGGGAGYLGRRHGLAANWVRALEVVLPDGRFTRVDADTEPDLYWAIRGGGGSFAVVIGMEIELVPVATAYAGFMFWPVERADEVLHAWLAWTRDVSREVTSVGRILQFPPIPDVPEPMRGRAFAGFTAALLGSSDDAARIVEPLRRLGPEIDTFAEVPAPALTRIHLDPEDPVPAVADSFVVRGFDAGALDALLAACPPASPSHLLITEIRHLGGAFSEPGSTPASAGMLGGDHLVFGVGLAMSPEMGAAADTDLDRLAEAVRPWLAPRQYMNLADRPRPAEELFSPPDLARLREIRRRYDPERILLSNRPLEAVGQA